MKRNACPAAVFTHPPIQSIQPHYQLPLPLAPLLPQFRVLVPSKDLVITDRVGCHPFGLVYPAGSGGGGVARNGEREGPEPSGGLEGGEGRGSEGDVFVVVPFYRSPAQPNPTRLSASTPRMRKIMGSRAYHGILLRLRLLCPRSASRRRGSRVGS